MNPYETAINDVERDMKGLIDDIFCNFDASKIDLYRKALKERIEANAEILRYPDIYYGGGSPGV